MRDLPQREDRTATLGGLFRVRIKPILIRKRVHAQWLSASASNKGVDVVSTLYRTRSWTLTSRSPSSDRAATAGSGAETPAPAEDSEQHNARLWWVQPHQPQHAGAAGHPAAARLEPLRQFSGEITYRWTRLASFLFCFYCLLSGFI